MEQLKLGEFVRSQEDRERRGLLDSEIRRASVLSGGFDFSQVEISSTGEMNEAAGCCEMCTGDISVREDIVTTETGIREMLCHVLVHEAEHAGANGSSSDARNFLEGMTEWATTLKTGQPPVPAYAEKVRHAEHIAEVVGRKEALELARKPEGKVLLMSAYFESQVQKNLDPEQAAQEAQQHVEMAA